MSSIETANITGDVDAATLNHVRRLLTTPENSIPFLRGFGVDISKIDDIKMAAEGILLAEYSRKLKTYFPDLKIKDISYQADNNKLTPTVVITNA